MKNNTPYYIAWAVLYAACAGLSFISEPPGILPGLMVVLALAFFVPPAILLYRAITRKERGTLLCIGAISAASLVLTFVMLLLNFLSFEASAAAGLVLNAMLILVSVPMLCSGAWVVSLFLWAILLMICLKFGKKP